LKSGIIQTKADGVFWKLVRVVDLRRLAVFDPVKPLFFASDTTFPSTSNAAADS
jgi:hypothetical protein